MLNASKEVLEAKKQLLSYRYLSHMKLDQSCFWRCGAFFTTPVLLVTVNVNTSEVNINNK